MSRLLYDEFIKKQDDPWTHSVPIKAVVNDDMNEKFKFAFYIYLDVVKDQGTIESLIMHQAPSKFRFS